MEDRVRDKRAHRLEHAPEFIFIGAMHKKQFSFSERPPESPPEQKSPTASKRERVRDVIGKIKKNVSTAIQNDNAVTAVRRYYSNAVTDSVKQQAINVFVGHFQARTDEPDIW
jgi:hypothetical protein